MRVIIFPNITKAQVIKMAGDEHRRETEALLKNPNVSDNNKKSLEELEAEFKKDGYTPELAEKFDQLLNAINMELAQPKLINDPYVRLSFDNLGLTRVPPELVKKIKEIGPLGCDGKLNLQTNNLTTLPPQIGSLNFITDLNLKDNPLMSMPSELGNVEGLRFLIVDFKTFNSLPQSLKPLLDRLYQVPPKSDFYSQLLQSCEIVPYEAEVEATVLFDQNWLDDNVKCPAPFLQTESPKLTSLNSMLPDLTCSFHESFEDTIEKLKHFKITNGFTNFDDTHSEQFALASSTPCAYSAEALGVGVLTTFLVGFTTMKLFQRAGRAGAASTSEGQKRNRCRRN